MSSVKSRQNASSKNAGYKYSGAEIQNKKKSKVYVFGDADVCEDEIVEFEMSDVRSRKGQKQTSTNDEEPIYYEREITEGDTLRSISLQYGCPVAEIKRINNIIQDQEFYAFRKIKVPIKKYSFLTETIKVETNSEKPQFNGMTVVDETDTDTYNTDSESACNLSDPETQRLLIKKSLSIKDHTNSQSREAKRFLRSMDKDLVKICKSAKTNHRSLDEVVSVLTNRSIQPIPAYHRRKSYGADCGITWWRLLICSIIAAITIPLIVVFFLWKFGHVSFTSAGQNDG